MILKRVTDKQYLMLNKPKGYISATEDNTQPTVLDLIPTKYLHRNLFPAGRLDKDTTGLLIITDDGEFAHNAISPKKDVDGFIFGSPVHFAGASSPTCTSPHLSQ